MVKCFVRLACVKHAASVHPEPGSNSHIKVFILPESSGWISVPLLLLVKGSHLLFRCIFRCCSLNYSLWIFQGYFTVQLSRFSVLLSYATTSISYHSFAALSTGFFIFLFLSHRTIARWTFIIAPNFMPVNSFFHFFYLYRQGYPHCRIYCSSRTVSTALLLVRYGDCFIIIHCIGTLWYSLWQDSYTNSIENPATK